MLRRLVAVGRALAETRDQAAIFHSLRGFVAEFLPFDTFLISMLDTASRTRRCVYCWGDGVEVDASLFEPLALNDGPPSRALVTGKPVVCDDLPNELPAGAPIFNVGEDPRQTRSWLIVPMVTGGRVVGSIQLQSYDAARYTYADAVPLAAVADHAAAALENARLLEEAARAERLAARAREQWERTFDAMADAVVLVDGDDRVVRANRAFLTMTRQPAGIEGRELAAVLHRDDFAARSCEVCIARREGREGTMLAIMPSAKHRLGVHYEIKLNRVEAAGGEFAGMVQVLRDVTALRIAEAELASREAILDTVLSCTTDAIALLDAAGKIVWVNAAIERLGSETPESLRGRNLIEFFDEPSRPYMAELLRRVVRGETVRLEHDFTRDDGMPLLLELVLSPVVEADRVTGLVATARDITERRASMERASEGEKLRALGQLAAGVAHDFNNLLASILGYAQLLARLPAAADPSIARKLAAIEQAARDGAETVRRIQNFTRVHPDPSGETIRAEDLLRESVDLARPRWKDQAQASGSRIHVEIEPVDAALTIAGNGAELREVMTNLIINAVDAMPGGGRITLSAAVEDGWALLRVRDTGHGMDEQTRRRIFEPFFTTRGPQNSGLGLAVSYGIVTRHGGAIDVESEPYVATTITVRLPVSGEQAAGNAGASKPAATSLDLRILVVDDEQMVRDVVADSLRMAGADVVAIGSGREAIEALGQSRFDLVVTDLGMPDVNGWDVARAAARLEPRPRVLLLTGWGDAAAPDAATSGLVERVLAKPIEMHDLIAAARGARS